MKANISIESQVLTALKKAKVATRTDVRQIVGEEIDGRDLASKKDVREIVGTEIDARDLASKKDVREIVGTEIDARDLASKKDVREIVGTEIDARDLASKKDVNGAILGSERRLKLQMNKQKREIISLMVRLAETTPTRREFRALEQRVDLVAPVN